MTCRICRICIKKLKRKKIELAISHKWKKTVLFFDISDNDSPELMPSVFQEAFFYRSATFVPWLLLHLCEGGGGGGHVHLAVGDDLQNCLD